MLERDEFLYAWLISDYFFLDLEAIFEMHMPSQTDWDTFYSSTYYHEYLPGKKDQQTKYCRALYDGIKSDPKLRFDDNTNPETYMPFVEFERIYDASCRDALNKRRQYTQTLCQAAVVGEFEHHLDAEPAFSLLHWRLQ